MPVRESIKLDLNAKMATEVWNHEMGQAINSPICSSVYEDAPLNYLIDYSIVGGLGLKISMPNSWV